MRNSALGNTLAEWAKVRKPRGEGHHVVRRKEGGAGVSF